MGDKNRMNGDEAKLEDNDNNNTGTTAAHVRETAVAQDAGATSNRLSIGAHISDVTEINVPSTQFVQELLAAHPVVDPIWDHTYSYDILIDTVNSVEAMTGGHTVEPEYIFRKPNPGFEYIEHIVYVSSDTIEEDWLYKFMNNYDKWDDLSNTAIVFSDKRNSHTIFTVVNTSESVYKSIKLYFWIVQPQS